MLVASMDANNSETRRRFSRMVVIVLTLSILLYMLRDRRIINRSVNTMVSFVNVCRNSGVYYSNLSESTLTSAAADHAGFKIAQRSGIFGKDLISFMKSRLMQSNGSLETTVECIGPLYNQSCLFKNLYYKNSTFMVLTVKGRNLPSLTVRPDYYPPFDLTPTKIEFESLTQLESFVRTSASPVPISSLTVYFQQLWDFNVAHALFDGLYPAYLALIRFAPLHHLPFRLLLGAFGCEDCWTTDACRRFGGLGIMKLGVLNKASLTTWFVFESIVMGSGNMCQRCTRPNLQLPGGVELDGSRLFRNRMYVRHGFLPPVPRPQHSAQNRNPKDPLIAYIIHNKRYTAEDRKEMNAAIKEININTDIQVNNTKLKINATQKHRPLIRISYLDYSHVEAKKNTSLYFSMAGTDSRTATSDSAETKLAAELRILRTMGIHITGPGTGQLFQTFLPDGSVTVNLGGLGWYTYKNKPFLYASFMEEYVAAGTPYIRGLYYPINDRWKGIKKNEVMKLVEEAAELISNGFTMPVKPKDSLAADGKLFIEMCEKDVEFCKSATERKVGGELHCNTMWIEEFVHEVKMWSPEGFTENGRKIRCPFNRTLLDELRQKYGIKHDVN